VLETYSSKICFVDKFFLNKVDDQALTGGT